MTKPKKNSEQVIAKLKQNIINLNNYIAIFAVIISIIALGCSVYISNEAKSIAEDANNISLTALYHQRNIEESDLQIGPIQYFKYRPSIRIPLINGYYARYPAFIVSTKSKLNGNQIEFLNVPSFETNTTIPENYRIIERDTPVYIEIIFTEPSNLNESYDSPVYTIRFFSSNKDLLKGHNRLNFEIHYHDFSSKSTFTINTEIDFNFIDGQIHDANLVYVSPKRLIKQINQS